MHSRVLLCAFAALAIAAPALIVPQAVDAGTYPSNKCAADKLKAASGKCKAAFGAWAKFAAGGGLDTATRDAALGKATTKMGDAWTKAETKAAAKDVDCVDLTLATGDMQTLIDNAVAGVFTDVTGGLNLALSDDAKCASALLKAAGGACASYLKNEAGYINKLAAGKGKRDAGNTKAGTKLADAVNKQLPPTGSCPTTATLSSIDTAVGALAADVTTNVIVSPNVDDTQFTMISPAEYPGIAYGKDTLHPICSLGTPYHYFVKRGSVNKLVVYYQGGGACWDYNTCVFVGTFDKEVDPGSWDNPNNIGTGFGDLTNANNPFKDWNIVFVPYCTGDIHFGDSLPSYGGTPIRHKGWHNARTAEKWAREHFVAPEEIFVTGSSAGAYGAFFNAPLHHDVWPDSKFSILGDAGNGIITPSFLQNEFNQWNFVAHLPTNIPGVAEAITGGVGIPAYTEAVADYYPNTAWGHYTTSYDGGTGGQTGFYNVMLNLHPLVILNWPSWWNASCAWNGVMRSQAIATAAAAPSNYRYYIGTGSRHTMWGDDKVYTDTSGNVPTIVDWINAMRGRTPAWTNVECDSPASCGTLLPGDPQPGTLPTPPFSQSGPDVIITCP
ncbi:MAG: hypothetical protein IT294_01980 [Deltaproteobacteria bacterium]|nr:hypothetical protein [Deltaproteobacteria bacterium]